jgi:hypothetical protein
MKKAAGSRGSVVGTLGLYPPLGERVGGGAQMIEREREGEREGERMQREKRERDMRAGILIYEIWTLCTSSINKNVYGHSEFVISASSNSFLRVTGYGLRVTGYNIGTIDMKGGWVRNFCILLVFLRVTGYGLRVTGYKVGTIDMKGGLCL